MILLKLFWSFMLIGFGSFGGLSMIPQISNEVLSHGWMTADQVTDIVAIAEMTPGPLGLNCASFAGMQAAGIPGAIAANFGVLTPSITLCAVAAIFFHRFHESKVMQHILLGVRPICLGMVAGVVISLSLSNYWSGHKPGMDMHRSGSGGSGAADEVQGWDSPDSGFQRGRRDWRSSVCWGFPCERRTFMTEKEMIDLALAEGVSAAEMTDTKDIVFDPMVPTLLCGKSVRSVRGQLLLPPGLRHPGGNEAADSGAQTGAGAANHLGNSGYFRQRPYQAGKEGTQRHPASASEEIPRGPGSPAFWWEPAGAACALPAI